jgi:hypothetical protein
MHSLCVERIWKRIKSDDNHRTKYRHESPPVLWEIPLSYSQWWFWRKDKKKNCARGPARKILQEQVDDRARRHGPSSVALLGKNKIFRRKAVWTREAISAGGVVGSSCAPVALVRDSWRRRRRTASWSDDERAGKQRTWWWPETFHINSPTVLFGVLYPPWPLDGRCGPVVFFLF